MGHGHVQAKSSLNADDFHRYLIDKVTKIRYSTVDAPEPSYDATWLHVWILQLTVMTS